MASSSAIGHVCPSLEVLFLRTALCFVLVPVLLLIAITLSMDDVVDWLYPVFFAVLLAVFVLGIVVVAVGLGRKRQEQVQNLA